MYGINYIQFNVPISPQLFTRYIHVFLTCSGCYILLLVFHYQTTFSLCPGEATATGGDITFYAVKIATWDARAKWDFLASNLGVDNGTIDVSVVQIGLCRSIIA